MVRIGKSQIHGKGVFAERRLSKGETLTCDVLPVNNIYWKVLRDYQFPWDRDNSSLCMGFGSYLNHSDTPNTRILSIDKENLTKTFVILSDVDAGCELTIEYSMGCYFNEVGTSTYGRVPRIDG